MRRAADAGPVPSRLPVVLRVVWRAYKWLAILLGTVALAYGAISAFRLATDHGVMSAVVPLESGFVFHPDDEDARSLAHDLRDAAGNVVIYSNVVEFTEHREFVYGLRRDLRNHTYYFFCQYGENCDRTQHLSRADLDDVTAALGLPRFGTRGMTSDRDRLLQGRGAGQSAE